MCISINNGDMSNVTNYRPISILSCFSKILESLVSPALFKHIQNVISNHQHEFLSGRSVNLNLISFISDAAKNIGDSKETHAVYTDFQSAFDKADHLILLSKLF